MTGTTISHYSALWNPARERNPRKRDKILEKMLLPGLSKSIQVKDIATPLTNVRCTSNYRGAAYAWNKTVNNSGGSRNGHKTPIENLYLAGAWSKMGHGYGAVIGSGLTCFSEIMQQW